MASDTRIRRAEERVEQAAERGWAVVTKDRYEVVFVLIMITILANAFLGYDGAGPFIMTSALTLTLAVTLVTSNASRTTVAVAGGLVALAFLVAVAAQLTGHIEVARHTYRLAIVAMGVVVPVVIASRIAKHPTITLNTIAGAADIYLLFGLVFAVVFSLVGDYVLATQPAYVASLGGPPTAARAFFVSGRTPVPSDFVYYSFVTLTTVGYGDLTASTGLGRMLSVSESLLGQLYLVTVVAVLVGNMGRRRRAAEATDSSGVSVSSPAEDEPAAERA